MSGNGEDRKITERLYLEMSINNNEPVLIKMPITKKEEKCLI